MNRAQWAAFIMANAARYGVDPAAALAVASQEGLGGGVGDAGTSFGPFQLHVGGALPKGRGRAWAESPAGILYALRQMGQVAGGLTGAAAVRNIVRRFERPADPASEIAGALAAYGNYSGGKAPGAPGVPPSAPGGLPTSRTPATMRPPDPGYFTQRVFNNAGLAQGIFSALASGQTPDVANLVGQNWTTERIKLPPLPTPPGAVAPRAGVPGSRPASGTPAAPGVNPLAGGALAEAFYDPLGSYDQGAFGGAIGHHMDHVHLSIIRAAAMIAAINKARAMGLRVGENPYVDKVDPVHVKGSFHYRDFPSGWQGKPLGEAIDVSGDPKLMAAYYRWATSPYR